MSSAFIKILFFLFFLVKLTASGETEFTFNGFSGANLTLDGSNMITSNGLLVLTNTSRLMMGHAFYPVPLHFKSPVAKTFSFSTTFVFAMIPHYSNFGGDGIAFVISHTTDFSTALPNQYFGLFNMNNMGKSSNHIFAVELDTINNRDVQDINDNHVGIDINSVKSSNSRTAGYYEDTTGSFKNLTLISGQQMQVWIDLDGEKSQLNVTLSPAGIPKPSRALLSSNVDLTSLMLDSMFVGFSSSSGSYHTSHYILGWSFKMNGIAEPLDYAKLPSLPRIEPEGDSVVLKILLPVASFLLLILAASVFIARRKIKYAQLLEDWELGYGPHRFTYKDLFQATKGFKEKELLGSGGFGRVYRGVMPTSKMEVAVKKVSHESRQGMREFVAEIVSIGHMRHRNLVQLLGYCRRKGELLSNIKLQMEVLLTK